MLTTMRLRAACAAAGLRKAIFPTVGLLGLGSVLFILRQGRKALRCADGRGRRARVLPCRSQRPACSHGAGAAPVRLPEETTADTASGRPVGAGQHHRRLGEQPLGTVTVWEETGEEGHMQGTHWSQVRTPYHPPNEQHTERSHVAQIMAQRGLFQLSLLPCVSTWTPKVEHPNSMRVPVLFRLRVQVHLSKGVHRPVEPGFKERVKHVGFQNLKERMAVAHRDGHTHGRGWSRAAQGGAGHHGAPRS